jgi:heme O synthase-like polyprenyltransferase
VDSGALALFWVLFFWQIPHVLALDWLYRSDHAHAGYRTFSVFDPAGKLTQRWLFASTLLLVGVSAMPWACGLVGRAYLWGAFGLGGLFVVFASYAWVNLDRAARLVFRYSIVYLAILWVLLAATRI